MEGADSGPRQRLSVRVTSFEGSHSEYTLSSLLNTPSGPRELEPEASAQCQITSTSMPLLTSLYIEGGVCRAVRVRHPVCAPVYERMFTNRNLQIFISTSRYLLVRVVFRESVNRAARS